MFALSLLTCGHLAWSTEVPKTTWIPERNISVLRVTVKLARRTADTFLVLSSHLLTLCPIFFLFISCKWKHYWQEMCCIPAKILKYQKIRQKLKCKNHCFSSYSTTKKCLPPSDFFSLLHICHSFILYVSDYLTYSNIRQRQPE